MDVGDEMNDLITVYVKAGADGQRLGACPFCQRVFMVLLLKCGRAGVDFSVVPVTLSRPPEEFRRRSLRCLPALVVADRDDVVLDTVDDIITYLDARYPRTKLCYDNADADCAVKDLFGRFCFFIKQVSKDSSYLEGALAKLDSYLARVYESDASAKFLCAGTELCHLDCELLPKLQHIRVACAALKHFHVAAHWKHVWRYLHNAYSHQVFVTTCPSDQEIILHWVDRPQMASLTYDEHKRLVQQKSSYSFDVPAKADRVTLVE